MHIISLIWIEICKEIYISPDKACLTDREDLFADDEEVPVLLVLLVNVNHEGKEDHVDEVNCQRNDVVVELLEKQKCHHDQNHFDLEQEVPNALDVQFLVRRKQNSWTLISLQSFFVNSQV